MSKQRSEEPRPSLRPELLSGRSLEAPRRSRRETLREHRGKLALVLAVLLVVVVVVAGKLLAERAADSHTTQRAEELRDVLDGATPADFLAFDAGVRTPGTLASTIRHTDGFVNVRAGADRAVIRFQPAGWWAGFTERCIVAVVRDDGVEVTVPHTACVRVPVDRF